MASKKTIINETKSLIKTMTDEQVIQAASGQVGFAVFLRRGRGTWSGNHRILPLTCRMGHAKSTGVASAREQISRCFCMTKGYMSCRSTG